MEVVGMVGCGLTGAGITEVCARAALDVTVVESGIAAAETGAARLAASLTRAKAPGKIQSAEEVQSRITLTTELETLAPSALVVEAAVENEAVKVALFRQLDSIVGTDALLASNTSSIQS